MIKSIAAFLMLPILVGGFALVAVILTVMDGESIDLASQVVLWAAFGHAELLLILLITIINY